MKKKINNNRRRVLQSVGVAVSGSLFIGNVSGTNEHSGPDTDFDPNDNNEADQFAKELEAVEKSGSDSPSSYLEELDEDQEEAVLRRITLESVGIETTENTGEIGISSNDNSVSRSITGYATAGNRLFTFTHNARWE
ncbi:MAG: hypothetical protein IH933_04125 [Euryarchaeota archaeon]|jgi:hypothetical protein|nr:hypothetical protein [Euryarchaeota archaeon]